MNNTLEFNELLSLAKRMQVWSSAASHGVEVDWKEVNRQAIESILIAEGKIKVEIVNGHTYHLTPMKGGGWEIQEDMTEEQWKEYCSEMTGRTRENAKKLKLKWEEGREKWYTERENTRLKG